MASHGLEPDRVLSSDSSDVWYMKRHATSAFKQQRLPAWSPILSPTTVLPFFLIAGALLIPVGVGMLFLSGSVQEHEITYTDCRQYFPENGTFGQRNCAEVIMDTNETCYCAYNFCIPCILKKPVFIYYHLGNYHQNHRRYLNSRDDNQLLGKLEHNVSCYCAPHDYDDDGRAIVPCGAIADSLFNDTLVLQLLRPSPATPPAPPSSPSAPPVSPTTPPVSPTTPPMSPTAPLTSPTVPPVSPNMPPVSPTAPLAPCENETDGHDCQPHCDECQPRSSEALDVPVLRTGISWPTDKTRRFANPPGNLTEALAGFAKPRSWRRHLFELDTENEDNNGLLNEDLIVWMRTAGLPTFRKLYRRVDHSRAPFADGLPPGNYTLLVEYNYPVASFRGSKTFIVTSTTAIGVGNQFLGAAYVTSGCVCLLMGAVFFAVHLRYRRANALMVSVEPGTPYL